MTNGAAAGARSGREARRRASSAWPFRSSRSTFAARLAPTALLAVAVACAPKHATEPTRDPVSEPTDPPVATMPAPLLIRAPRPDVTFPDLAPDLSEEPRWPLTGMQHPSLQPTFDIAGALAEPGITWTELCDRNVDRRRDPSHRDELIYLGAWCAAQRHDPVSAVGLLAQVRRSSVPGIAHAVPFDIIDILVDSQDLEHADQILAKAQVRSVELYDLLAAAYFEIGRTDDSVKATAAALQLDTAHELVPTCHRLARAALLSPKASRDLLVVELTETSHRKPPDPVCAELATDVACELDPAGGCATFDAQHHVDVGVQALARIALDWDRPRTWTGWVGVAHDIHNTVVRPQSAAMLVGAIEAAIVASDCDRDAMRSIESAIDAMGADRSIAHVGWLAQLADQPGECARFRERWLADHPQ